MNIRSGLQSLVVLVGTLSLPVQAFPELDMHGALAQGFVISDGNNTVGSSLNGSRDLYEVALNARTRLSPKTLVSGQVMARRSGNADLGKLRVDYAQFDYQFISGINGDIGGRIGKLKNPYGFYNDTRDIVFSRPGITIPSSVYFDQAGVRDLLFSSEGVQLYGRYLSGANATDVTLGWGRDYDASDRFPSLGGKIEIEDFLLGQVMQDLWAGRFRLGLSYLSGDVSFRPAADSPTPAIRLGAALWVGSVQMSGEKFQLTSEVRYADIETNFAGTASQSKTDGAYIQFRRITSFDVEWYLQYDVSFQDRNDRDGRELARRESVPREQAFARDYSVGISWRPGSNWGLFAEYHYIDGTATVSREDNAGRSLDRYWQKTLFMLAYRF